MPGHQPMSLPSLHPTEPPFPLSASLEGGARSHKVSERDRPRSHNSDYVCGRKGSDLSSVIVVTLLTVPNLDATLHRR